MKNLITRYKNLTFQQLRTALLVGYGLYLVPGVIAVGIGLVRSIGEESRIISHFLNILYYSVYGITAGLVLLTIRMASLAQGKSKILWQGNLLALILLFPVIPFIWGMIIFIIVAMLTIRLH